MKTLNALLKTISVILLLVVFFSLQINAQESDEKKKEVKIKMVKTVDGKETVIDTTFEVSSLEDLEGIKGLEDIDVQMMSFETDGDEGEKTMIITKEIEEVIGEDGETIQTIDLIVEMADSLDKAKVIKIQMDGDEQTVFISDDEEIKTIETEDGTKTIIVKHKGEGDEDVIFVNGDEVDWHEKDGTNVQVETSEDGDKVIVTKENGEVKEFLIKDGKGAYMIDDEGNVTKAEGDKDIIWTEDEGDNVWVNVEADDDGKVIVIKSTDGEVDIENLNMEHNVFLGKEGQQEEQEIFVSVIKKKVGDETIIIKTKVIIETLDDEDKETMEKAGVNLFPESEENKLEVESLKFSPNPSNGKFKLKFTTPEEVNTDIKIYNIHGTEVYSESLKNFNGTFEKEIDISGEKSGTYFLKVAQGDNIMSRKIVVE